jgi:hypothetical protein
MIRENPVELEDKRHIEVAVAIHRVTSNTFVFQRPEDFELIAQRLSRPQIDELVRVAGLLEKYREQAREV